MTKCKQLLLLTGICLLNFPVFADAPGNYWGVGYIGLDFTAENTLPVFQNGAPVLDSTGTQVRSDSVSGNQGLAFKLGRELGKFMAVELHFGVTNDSDMNDIGTQSRITYGGAFFRLNLPYPNFNLYVMGGASQMNFDFGERPLGSVNAGVTVDGDESAAAAGFGMDFFGSETGALTIEFMRYGTDNTANVYMIGYKHHFNFVGFR